MTKYATLIASILISFYVNNTSAQDTITTLKGDVLQVENYEIITDNDYKEIRYLNDRGKPRYIDYESVFSIKTEEKKSVVYKPQSENDLSVEQMKHMVQGHIDGKSYNSFWAPFLITYTATVSTGFLGQGDIFVAPLVPLGTTISIGLYGWFSDPKTKYDNEYYNVGYNEKRTYKLIKASLLGGGAGLLTAATIHTIRFY